MTKGNAARPHSTDHGTHSGDGGPVAATGNAVASDYAYVMQFEEGKIRHIS